MSEIFKTVDQISKEYGIARSVIYDRINKHRYRTCEKDRTLVLVMDVENIEQKGIRKGRPRKYK